MKQFPNADASSYPETGQQIVARKLIIPKGHVFDYNATAAADIFGTDISPTVTPAIFRINAVVGTAGKITVTYKETGSTATHIANMNADTNLTASAFYSEDFVVYSGQTVNLRFSATGKINTLSVVEVW